MPTCPNCGREVSDDASFCPACGATVTAAAGGGVLPPQPQTTPPHPQPPGPPMGAQPPYAQQPPGAPPAYAPGTLPPAPVKKKTGSGWKIALVAGLVVLLLVGVVVALLGLLVFRAVKEPVDVTNRYIEAVNDGDAEEAWDLLHPESPLKYEYTLSTFESQVLRTSVRLTAWDANQVEVKDSRALVGVDMEDVNGDEYQVDFELRKDGGDWKVYDYSAG